MEEQKDNPLGVRLRTERHHQEKTLKDVADAAQVTTSYLSQIERGQRTPKPDIKRRLLATLGLNETVVREATDTVADVRHETVGVVDVGALKPEIQAAAPTLKKAAEENLASSTPMPKVDLGTSSARIDADTILVCLNFVPSFLVEGIANELGASGRRVEPVVNYFKLLSNVGFGFLSVNEEESRARWQALGSPADRFWIIVDLQVAKKVTAGLTFFVKIVTLPGARMPTFELNFDLIELRDLPLIQGYVGKSIITPDPRGGTRITHEASVSYNPKVLVEFFRWMARAMVASETTRLLENLKKAIESPRRSGT